MYGLTQEQMKIARNDIMRNPCKHDFAMKCLKDAYNMRKREWNIINRVLLNSKFGK
ncbi:hypothetical protein [Proteus phage 2207-N35]|nr:hypothetical protein [Proteus phage 2207-N35]